jgi:dTDP-4-dehydrorhamnose 3,5-epimerase
MKKFEIIDTPISKLLIIEPKIFEDNRGYFFESYNKKEFEENGFKVKFVQDNHSRSKKGVLRGLHFQKKHSQGKLINVVQGKIWDVVVDLRTDSETFGKWYGIELSEINKRMLYVPEDFAHGFLALEDDTVLQYKCTDYYYPEYESGINWNDKNLKIDWPLEKYGISEAKLIISAKDAVLGSFNKEFDK